MALCHTEVRGITQSKDCEQLLSTYFEPLHNLHLKVLNLFTDCTVDCLSLDRRRTEGARKGTKPFAKIRSPVLRGCNLFLRAIERNDNFLETRINITRERQMAGKD